MANMQVWRTKSPVQQVVGVYNILFEHCAVPTLTEAAKELTEVIEWHVIGQNLNMPEVELANMDSDRTLKDSKAHMLKW